MGVSTVCVGVSISKLLTFKTFWCKVGNINTSRLRVLNCSLKSCISANNAKAGRFSMVRSGTGKSLMNCFSNDDISEDFLPSNEKLPLLKVVSISSCIV